MRGIILAFALALSLNATPQDQVKVGSLKFTPPKGWKATGDSGPTTAIFAPPDVPAGKSCVIKVFPEEFDKDGFQAWYNRRWNRTVTGGHFVLRMSELEKKKVAGVDLVMRSAAYKKGTGEGYIFVFGLALKDKFFCLWYESDDFDYMEKHQDEVYKVFETLELAEGPPPTTGSSQGTPGTKPPVDKGNETKPPTGEKQPAESTKTSPAIGPADFTGPWVADPAGPKRTARLSEIADLLQDPKSDVEALFTEAARQCGFVIWTEKRTPVSQPIGSPRLYLALTTTEIEAYSKMFRAGHSVRLGDLIASLDVVYKPLTGEPSIGPRIISWLESGEIDPNPSHRALVRFLHELSAGRRMGFADALSDENANLDPIQVLCILRIVTQEMYHPVKKALEKGGGTELFASLTPPIQNLTDWEEDLFVATFTTISDAIQRAMGVGEVGAPIREFSRFQSRMNLTLCLAKFIATYISLVGELRVESPGEPLVRTKDTSAGEERTLVAKFYIDGSYINRVFKDMREGLSFVGFDLDMPRSGALKGVETFWSVDQSVYPSKQLIRGIRGGGGLDRVKTDNSGEARVTFEGSPQRKAMVPNQVIPVMKQVLVTVTPQVKAVEMKQDLVDAVTGAIGLRAGAQGLIEILFEQLYRLKWSCPTSLNLQVKDWIEYENVGQFKMEISGHGEEGDQGFITNWDINRSLEFVDVGMSESGGLSSAIDPQILKTLPEAKRREAEDAYKKASFAMKNKVFTGELPGRAAMKIMDRKIVLSRDGCDPDSITERTTWSGDYPLDFAKRAPEGTEMMFRVEVDTDAKTASIIPLVAMHVKYVHIRTSKKNGRTVTRRDEMAGMFGGLKFMAPFETNKPLVIPLQQVDILHKGLPAYRGSGVIHFGFGPNNRFHGEAKFSYTIIRNPKKPK